MVSGAAGKFATTAAAAVVGRHLGVARDGAMGHGKGAAKFATPPPPKLVKRVVAIDRRR